MSRHISGGTTYATKLAEQIFNDLGTASGDPHGFTDFGQYFADLAVVLQRVAEAIESAPAVHTWYGRLLKEYGPAAVEYPLTEEAHQADMKLMTTATEIGTEVMPAVDALLALAKFAQQAHGEYDEAGMAIYETNSRYAGHRQATFRTVNDL